LISYVVPSTPLLLARLFAWWRLVPLPLLCWYQFPGVRLIFAVSLNRLIRV
jgi:hypothetical protein